METYWKEFRNLRKSPVNSWTVRVRVNRGTTRHVAPARGPRYGVGGGTSRASVQGFAIKNCQTNADISYWQRVNGKTMFLDMYGAQIAKTVNHTRVLSWASERPRREKPRHGGEVIPRRPPSYLVKIFTMDVTLKKSKNIFLFCSLLVCIRYTFPNYKSMAQSIGIFPRKPRKKGFYGIFRNPVKPLFSWLLNGAYRAAARIRGKSPPTPLPALVGAGRVRCDTGAHNNTRRMCTWADGEKIRFPGGTRVGRPTKCIALTCQTRALHRGVVRAAPTCATHSTTRTSGPSVGTSLDESRTRNERNGGNGKRRLHRNVGSL